jgi:hypothetical protein
MKEHRPIFRSDPDGNLSTPRHLINEAIQLVVKLEKWPESRSETERQLIATVSRLTAALNDMYDELAAAKQAIKCLGVDVDEVNTTMIAGVFTEEQDAIGRRSGFGRPGGFREFVLDRLDALERDRGGVF